MRAKNLFGKKSLKNLSSASFDSLGARVESRELVREKTDSLNRYLPDIDFEEPSNFVKYGLAERYYRDSIQWIYTTYPYDGSRAEKESWKNEASALDNYILENGYPKTTGYVGLTFDSSSYSQQNVAYDGIYSGITDKYLLFANAPYIYFRGTLNEGTDTERTKANVFDLSKSRSYNLYASGSSGNTVEFWFRPDNDLFLSGSGEVYESASFCLFDLWNGTTIEDVAVSSSYNYNRFLLEYSPYRNKQVVSSYPDLPTDSLFSLTYQVISNISGTVYFYGGSIPVGSETIFGLESGSWNHLAFSVKSTGSALEYKLYLNGELTETNTVIPVGSTGEVSEFSGSLRARIGAYQYLLDAPVGAAVDISGYGTMPFSVDEFRYWKSERSSEEIGNYWADCVGGGANTDDANVSLGVYYKFNEGIVDEAAVNRQDSVVLDYSGRISNGTIANYELGIRNTGSAINEYDGVNFFEELEPILYSYHPEVKNYLDNMVSSGSNYDSQNIASLEKTFPEHVLEEDQDEHLRNLIQILASYFDNIQLLISKLPDINDKNYTDSQLPFAERALKSYGLVVPELFTDSDILENILSKNYDKKFSKNISDIKNSIYQNLYNNLTYIFKSKGTEKSLRNIIRCFGIDEDLVTLNLYANNTTKKIDPSSRTNKVVRQKYVDFNHPDRFGATVYQTAGRSDDSSGMYEASFEFDVIFPDKRDRNSEFYFDTTFITSSIGGRIGSYNTSSFEDDYVDFHVKCVRPDENSKDGRIVLSSSFLNSDLETDTITDLYTGKRAHIVVNSFTKQTELLQNEKCELVSGSFEQSAGIKAELNVAIVDFDVIEEFHSASSYYANFPEFASQSAVFVGSKRTNLTGTVEEYSDVKVSCVRAFYERLSEDAIRAHALDIQNYGTEHPYRNQLSYNGNVQDPQADSLRLIWTFENVTGSDTSGEFVVNDVSKTRYYNDLSGTFVDKPQYQGFGTYFPSDDINVVSIEYINSARQTLPEVSNISDTVKILSADDETFGINDRPGNFYLTVEKSMYRTISEEMVNLFATINDFNNLIGEPVNRYRRNYKNMEKLRQLFFARITEVSEIERYLNYYKWIDDSLNRLLEQFIPASADFSEEVQTVIESHVLERNKYQHKLPTLEFKEPVLEGTLASGTISGEYVDIPAAIIEGVVSVDTTPRDNSYEVVQTSGRKKNNISLIDLQNSGTILTPLYAPTHLADNVDFEVPVRRRNESVFVERFNAPGDKYSMTTKYLDRESEEYSVYSTINYRNPDVRKSYNSKLGIPCEFGGLESGSATTASVHKVNNNPFSSSVDVRYDNGFVQHAIPQDDDAFVSEIVSASEHWEARYNRQHNIVTIQDFPKQRIFQRSGIDIVDKGIRGETTSSFVEPPVARSYPLWHRLNVSGSSVGLNLKYSYENLNTYFADPDLNDRLNLEDRETFYDRIVSMYSTKTSDFTPITDFVYLMYRQPIYPKASNFGMSEVRIRTVYNENSGIGVDGYDRDILERRKFWDDSLQSRGRAYSGSALDANGQPTTTAGLNSVGWIDSRAGVWGLDASGSHVAGSGSGGELNTYGFPMRAFTGHDLDFETPATASILYCDHQRVYFPTTDEEGMPEWKVPDETGLAPWYNNYEEFAADIRLYSKDYNLIPEFRISDLMEHYIVTKGGNFIDSVVDKFVLDGVENSSSANGTTESEEFFKYYVHTDPIRKIKKISEDHDGLAEVARFTLRCDAIKKLLPYNGFYPQQRTAQIAELFSQSYGSHIQGSASVDLTSATASIGQAEQWKLQSFLQPWYAPGIMYNSIKSGIAVDWAAYTGSIFGVGGDPYSTKYLHYGFKGAVTDRSAVASGTDFSLISSSFSLSFWAPSGQGSTISAISINDSVISNEISFSGDGDYYSVLVTDGAGNDITNRYVCSSTTSGNLFEHFVVLFDGSEVGVNKIKLYLNGVLLSVYDTVENGNIASLANFNNITFGQTVGGDWDIDEFSIFSQELTEANIIIIYNNGEPKDISTLQDRDMIAWWRMGENLDSGDIVNETSTNITNLDLKAGASIRSSLKRMGLLVSGSNFRVPFESLVSLKDYIPVSSSDGSSSMYLLEPSWYVYPSDASEYETTRYPYFTWDGKQDSALYELSVHNFLGEVPKFFLKNEGLATFTSKKSSEFVALNANTRYYMDIALYKTQDFDMIRSPHSGTADTGITYPDSRSYHGRYFGPALKMFDDSVTGSHPSSDFVADPSYAAYTPPYFYGKSVARVSFAPDESRQYSLGEILAGLDVEIVHDELQNRVADVFDDMSVANITSSALFNSAMSVTSSVNIFGRTRVKEVDYDLKSIKPTSARDPASSDFEVWTIYPRFECPTLNFRNVNADDMSRGPYGMWINSGSTIEDNKGIYLSLEESFKRRATAEKSVDQTTGSLISVCGFNPGSLRIGEIADQKDVYEAVVAIPFLDTPVLDEDVVEQVKIGNRYFLKIDKDIYNKQIAQIEVGQPAVPSGQYGAESDIASTSITDMYSRMQKYYIPPEYDFVTFKTPRTQPFVMYIVEFSETLDKEDLANIWQGVMPKCARRMESDRSIVSHELTKYEFYHGKRIPDGLRWMIFKVKRRAEKNYYNITADSSDDSRFKFKFAVGSEREPEYSYNYPYDFFSLVEYAKIDAEVELMPIHKRLDKTQIVDEQTDIVDESDNRFSGIFTGRTPKV